MKTYVSQGSSKTTNNPDIPNPESDVERVGDVVKNYTLTIRLDDGTTHTTSVSHAFWTNKHTHDRVKVRQNHRGKIQQVNVVDG